MSTGPHYLMLVFLWMSTSAVTARAPELSSEEQDKVPQRIIRTCCSFGSDLSMVGLPMVKVTQIMSIDQLGAHTYMGGDQEGNGIIYTSRGGFIDLGHLRDQADWTAFLYLQIRALNGQKDATLRMRNEGGAKSLHLDLSLRLSERDSRLVAGAIAYDISVWHEIATWFGASLVPMIPERYSSFSIEDAYSNVLGITLGMQSLKSDLPYDIAMSGLIDSTLEALGAVKTSDETYKAMEAVKDVWWTRERKLPTRKVLLQRDLRVYPGVTPWLVPGWQGITVDPVPLGVPASTMDGIPLSDFYRLNIRVNHKFPFRKMFPDREDRVVSQLDFDVMIHRVEWELANKDRLRGEEKTRYSAVERGPLPDVLVAEMKGRM
jgi:hypothetical protein